MSTETSTPVDSIEVADSRAVLEHLLNKTPLAPDIYRRVHERAARITEALREQHGTLNIAVELVRQAREE